MYKLTLYVEAINGQRELGFQKISEIIEAFKAKLFAQPAEEEEEVPENVLCRYMALGSVSFVSRDLGLGEFASPDHAGISLRILSQRILHAHSLPKFVVSSGTSRRIPNAGGIYDLKSHLQKAIDDLEMNEWGLEYNDYSPPNNHSRPDKTLDGEECTRTSST
jgi:hypothetical protein